MPVGTARFLSGSIDPPIFTNSAGKRKKNRRGKPGKRPAHPRCIFSARNGNIPNLWQGAGLSMFPAGPPGRQDSHEYGRRIAGA